MSQDELKNRLLLIEDQNGAESALYPLRELQSRRRISKTVTLKDSKGNLKTITLTVEGPVSVSGCTTREKVYEGEKLTYLFGKATGSLHNIERSTDMARQLARIGIFDMQQVGRYYEGIWEKFSIVFKDRSS